MVSPTRYPLLRMLWCDSVAPLGKPVVPEVYWMLIGSSAESPGCAVGGRSRSSPPPPPPELGPLGSVPQDDPVERTAVRADLLDHPGVVGGLERLGRDQ